MSDFCCYLLLQWVATCIIGLEAACPFARHWGLGGLPSTGMLRMEKTAMSLQGGQMITVRIGNEERDIKDASESWITEQLVRRRRDEGRVCVQIIIDESQVRLTLTRQIVPVQEGHVLQIHGARNHGSLGET